MHQIVVAERGAIIIGCAHALPKRSIYSNRTVINSTITCMQCSQKNFMKINFWEILERIIGKILSIIGAGLPPPQGQDFIYDKTLRLRKQVLLLYLTLVNGMRYFYHMV